MDFSTATFYMTQAMSALVYAACNDAYSGQWVAKAHSCIAKARQANCNIDSYERWILDYMQEKALEMEKRLGCVQL